MIADRVSPRTRGNIPHLCLPVPAAGGPQDIQMQQVLFSRKTAGRADSVPGRCTRSLHTEGENS